MEDELYLGLLWVHLSHVARNTKRRQDSLNGIREALLALGEENDEHQQGEQEQEQQEEPGESALLLFARGLSAIRSALLRDPLSWGRSMDLMHGEWVAQQALLSAGMAPATGRELDPALGLDKAVTTRTPLWLTRLSSLEVGDHMRYDAGTGDSDRDDEIVQNIAQASTEVIALLGGPRASGVAPVVTFDFPNSRIGKKGGDGGDGGLSLRVAECAFVETGLGWKTWTSAERFARLLLEEDQSGGDDDGVSVLGKRCVELGCGTGLLGLAAWAAGAASVIQTDYSRTMVDVASQNSSENQKALPWVTGRVFQRVLDWRWLQSDAALSDEEAKELQELRDLVSSERIDCVIAADVCYDEEHAALVANAAACLLEGSPAGSPFLVLIPTELFRRGVDTFQGKCEACGFQLLRKLSGIVGVDRNNGTDVEHYFFEFETKG